MQILFAGAKGSGACQIKNIFVILDSRTFQVHHLGVPDLFHAPDELRVSISKVSWFSVIASNVDSAALIDAGEEQVSHS